MKKLLYFFLSLALSVSLFSNFVQNPDKPLNGKWNFQPELVWKTDHAGKDLLTRVGGIRVDENGNIYVMDLKHGKIFVFDKNGMFKNSIGKKGEGPGEYKMAFNLFLTGDMVVVPEMGRMHFFKRDGKFVKTYIEKSFMFPRAFIDIDRMIYVKGDREGLGKKPETVNLFNIKTKKEKILMTIPPEKVMSAESGGMRLVIKDSQTTPGVVVFSSGKILYVGKSDKYIIKKIDLSGKELMSFSIIGRKRKPIPESVKRKRFENIMVNGGRMPKNMVDMMVKSMPDHATFFSRILCDKSGKIMVFISDLSNRNGQEMDIFSPQGKYLYHGEIKLNDYSVKSAITFKDGYIYLFGEDEDGEVSLLKYRIKFPE